MTHTPLFAHSLEGAPTDRWQTLEEHSRNVAELAEKFAAGFDSGEWARAAGWLHDLGKMSPRFQKYLAEQNELDTADYDVSVSGRVNHSSAGAAFAEEHFKTSGKLLAYLIAGHHAGLTDYYENTAGNGSLRARLEEGRENLREISAAVAELRKLMVGGELKPPKFVKKENCHLWLRMVFSCLTDADFLDTERFMNSSQAEQRGGFESLTVIKQRLDAALEKMSGAAGVVNGERRKVLAACRVAALRKPGLFTLTVPTGGGKTLSATAFALDHALRHGQRRVIYVIPYTSIIEQTAKVLSDICGPDNVVEHHSNIAEERQTLRSQLASENWDAPLIVTTNVQFFESLYASKPGRCRKLHNLADSVIILDEAQLLPPQWLKFCARAIDELVRNYGATVMLSTATQPALPLTAREIIADPPALFTALKRTTIHWPPVLTERKSWDDVATQLAQQRQALCIVNTRRDALELHEKIRAASPAAVHLSASMCGVHRSRIIGEIKEKLRTGEPLTVVSTQLVECGVDVDFPVVYRAFAGLDSIEQAAGRCNREGKLPDGSVYVFMPPRPAPRGLLRKSEDTLIELLADKNFDRESPARFAKYFRLFYGRVDDADSEALFKELIPDPLTMNFAFRHVAEKFKLIDDAYQPVLVRYDADSEDLIRRLERAGPNRELMRKLQRHASRRRVS
ncbi:MAG: CRISPR-associated endonuclease Cas3'' [Verrucomicrobiales bacterium]|jgi:CRISPR-associated endonuclease/helicase Cas3|nr:CRISPR-associated endonuclease Cas3'' [Verrucomicrobiales bacterium]